MDTANESFSYTETEDGPVVVLGLRGELDIAASQELQQRLEQLRAGGRPVRLDLAGLEFIDSTGIACITQAVRHARSDGWDLEVGRELQSQVQRLIELVDGESLFWPTA